MHLVGRIECELEIVHVVDVDVGKAALLAVFDDPLLLDVVLQAELIERVSHKREAIAEDVDIDVRPLADVARTDRSDQARPETSQQPHEPKAVEPHIAEILEPFRPFVHAGHGLNLVADFLVAR